MTRRYINILFALILPLLFAGCREDDLWSDDMDVVPGEVRFNIEIDGLDGNTRGIMEESKVMFEEGELLHIQAVYTCKHGDEPEYYERQYGLLEYKGRGKWEPHTSSRGLRWPDEAVTGTFKAYYFYGSTGELNENPMPKKLLSDYKFVEVPLSDEVIDIKYGVTVNLRMKHMFSYLTLTEMNNGVASELWFHIANTPGERVLNNAFYFKFDAETYEITPVFCQVPDENYVNENGQPLVYIKAKLNETEGENDIGTTVSYFLEPGVYYTFDLLYPRSRETYGTYLSYNRNLQTVTGDDGLLANHRYVFSVLKSLGIIVKHNPDEGWDENHAPIKIDVEEFLRSVNRGSDYFVDNEDGTRTQVLEKTNTGTRLLHNIDFEYFNYTSFGADNFRAIQNSIFDGNFHYIYHTACPLFFSNNGTITNLGLRDCETKEPLVSDEHLKRDDFELDCSYNGLIAAYNYATVINVRVINAKMSVRINATSSQEAHNAGLLFGVNRGNVYDIGLSGDLILNVENNPGNEKIPRVNIGALAAQNLGRFSGISFIDDPDYDFEYPEIQIINGCKGTNGVYKVGGVVGNNMGVLEDIFFPSVKVDASTSQGLESYLGGMIGDNTSSTASAPMVMGNIVRGEVICGEVLPQINLLSLCYTGGMAGSLNVQAIVQNNSVSVDVKGPAKAEDKVEYGTGGVFGILKLLTGYEEGNISDLAWYANTLAGPDYIGNFAGIAPYGFDWDTHYKDNNISLKKIKPENIGFIQAPMEVRRRFNK